MNAEIIAIGSEMLSGDRVDTNSLYLTAELNKLGVEVVSKCVIGDDRDRLAAQVRQSMARSAILILSGGPRAHRRRCHARRGRSRAGPQTDLRHRASPIGWRSASPQPSAPWPKSTNAKPS
jgi:hypothetical protein